MRWVCWMAVVGSAWVLAGPAGGAEVGCGCAASSPYAAPACGAPCYGMASGGCEGSSGCCQNVWDGYQQEQTEVRSFWRRVEAHCQAKLAEGRTCRGCGRPTCGSCDQPSCDVGDAGPTADPYYSAKQEGAKSAALTPAMGRTMGFRAPIRPKF